MPLEILYKYLSNKLNIEVLIVMYVIIPLF